MYSTGDVPHRRQPSRSLPVHSSCLKPATDSRISVLISVKTAVLAPIPRAKGDDHEQHEHRVATHAHCALGIPADLSRDRPWTPATTGRHRSGLPRVSAISLGSLSTPARIGCMSSSSETVFW